MSPKRVIAVVAVVLVSLVAGEYFFRAALRQTEPKYHLTSEKYLAIRDGMYEDDLVALLGPPQYRGEIPAHKGITRGQVFMEWDEDGRTISVRLEAEQGYTPKLVMKKKYGIP